MVNVPDCYECTAWAERKFVLQGSGLVRTLRLCAQRRVTLMLQAIAIPREALSNNRHKSIVHFERPAEQALALATKPGEVRGEVFSLSYLSIVW